MDAPLPAELLAERETIARLCDRFGVSRLEVFGSAADGRFDSTRGDFDFIARFDADESQSLARRYVAFSEALESLLGRPVDLMTDHPIGNPFLRRAVDATRRELYVRSAAQAPA